MKWNYYAISSSYAATASYALNASSTNTGSLLLNASALQNVITFTRGNGSVFNVTVATGSSISSAFPYTGSAQITGSLGITGSFSQQGSANIFLKGLINQVNPTSHVVMLDNTTGQLYITASSALGGGGGGGGTPGGLTGQIQYNNAGAFGGVPSLTFDGTTLRATGSFTGSFTGSLFGTSSWAVTASYAISASQAISASYVSYNNIVEYSDLSRNTIASVKNVSGVTILKGTPCHVTASGTSGNLLGIVPADAGNPNLMPAGIIAAQSLNVGDEGIGYIDGFINGVNTSTFNSGDEVYVAVGGGYTNIKPTGSALIQSLGYVEKVDISNGSGLINGPGYYLDVPNILSGYTWVGNTSQVATPVSTASFNVLSSISSSYALNTVSASYASTASYVQTAQTASYYKVFPYTGSAIISGSLIITGSTSITSGSLSVNKSGSTVVDIQGSQGQLFSIVDSLSGSLMSVNDVSGLPILEVFSDDRVVIGTYGAPGLIVSASRVSATGSFSGSFTGSLFGTSSWANNAITASFARTASYVNPLVQSVFISGSTQITGSTIIKGDFSVNSAATVDFNTNVLNINAPLITVPTFATPYSPSVNIRTVMYDAVSNALFVTSSLPGTGGGGTGLSNFISTGSITASVNTDINNLFLVKSGSVDLLKINSEKVLITFTQSATPTPIIGGIFISSSGDLFFGI
jgi:hypothetical protein